MLMKGLRDLLIDDPATSALVGPRVRIGRIPKGTDYPVVVIKVVSSEYIKTLRGVNPTQARLIQIDVWAETPMIVDQVAQVLHYRMNGLRGTLDEGTTVL